MPTTLSPTYLARVSVEHALNLAAEALGAAGVTAATHSQLMTHRAAFNERLASVSAGKSARVDYSRAVKRFVRDALPEFAFDSGGEIMTFHKRLADDLDILVDFEKLNFWGLGKAFRVNVGLAVRGTHGCEVRRSLASLVGADDRATWVYVTGHDLDAALAGVGDRLLAVLPVLESTARLRLMPLPSTLAADIPVREPQSAREASTEAARAAARWRETSQLAIVRGGRGWLSETENDIGLDGRTQLEGEWRLLFLDSASNGGLWVTVPRIGLLSARNFEIPESFSNRRLGSSWLDSDRALAVAEEEGGETLRFDAERWRITLGLEYDPPRYHVDAPIWRVHYMTIRKTQRADAMFTIDARSGKLIPKRA